MEYSLADIVHGMRHAQFRVALEPQVDLGTGRILGFECLARWAHPKDGLVSPGRFLPLLEASGLIGQFTLLVIERALSVRRRLRARGFTTSMSVNISSKSLIDWNFPLDISRLARNAEDGLKDLTLEITESSELSDDSLSSDCIRALHALGLRLSLDDFWTGYSSLSKPNLDAFEEVKIDYQLTKRIESDKVALAGVSSIQTFSRMLGWRCVVEGIESLDSVSLLRAIGCSVGQGHLFSRPIDEDHLEEWLDSKAPKGHLEFLNKQSSDATRMLPVLDEAQLFSLSRSPIPIWLFNIDKMRMMWANRAGLSLWMADDISEFLSRDFSSDMSDSVQRRLSVLRDLLQAGGTVAEQWTIYPKNIPKQVYSIMRGSRSAEGDFLLEVHGHEGIGPATASSPGTPTADTLPNPSLAVYEEGRIYWRNAAAIRTFPTLGDCFITACADPKAAFAFIKGVLSRGSGMVDLRIRGRNCSMPCRVDATRIRDPSTGNKAMIVSLTQLCDVYGCSHKSLDYSLAATPQA